jgi:predicted secreted protein
LPLGVRTQGEEGAIVPGTPGSAPAQPRLLRIVLLTTVLSSAIFALIWAAFRFGLVDFDALMGWGR